MDLSIDMDNSDLAVTVSTQFFWVDNRVIKLKKGVSKLNLDPNILNSQAYTLTEIRFPIRHADFTASILRLFLASDMLG